MNEQLNEMTKDKKNELKKSQLQNGCLLIRHFALNAQAKLTHDEINPLSKTHPVNSSHNFVSL